MAVYTAEIITAGGVTLSWEGDQFTLPQGCMISLNSGGALEAAIGTGNLAPVTTDGDPDQTGPGVGASN